MKIDAYTMNQIQNSYGIQNKPASYDPSKDITKDPAKVDSGANAFRIKDTYEPASEQLKVNFGGYDKNGRGGIAKLSAINSATPVNNDFSTKKTENANSYIMDGLSSVLNTDDESTKTIMKDAGLAVEDLVYPERAKTLSNDPATRTALEDFATSERSSLLAQSGMTNQELDNFVAAVK